MRRPVRKMCQHFHVMLKAVKEDLAETFFPLADAVQNLWITLPKFITLWIVLALVECKRRQW